MDVYAKHNITIVDEGSGPTILLVHGFGCDQNLWRPVVDRLRVRFPAGADRPRRVWVVRPGSVGPAKYSSLSGYAADILDIVDELHLRDVVFVGHSVSAMIGAAGDDHRSEQVRQARDADSLPVLHRRRRLPRRLLQGRYRRTAGIPPARIILAGPVRWRRSSWGHRTDPTWQDELADTFCRTDPERARVFARTTFLSDNRADLPRISLPTLVIECSQDAIAPREVGAYVHAHVHGSQLVTLDATGHCPHVSAPDATASAIADFRPGTVTDRSVVNFWDTAPSGHVIAHPDGRIIRANATLARWLGYEPNALCGKVFS